jgi:hypothetical protein
MDSACFLHIFVMKIIDVLNSFLTQMEAKPTDRWDFTENRLIVDTTRKKQLLENCH